MAHSTQLTGPRSRLLEADSDSSDKEISHFHKTRRFIAGSSYFATSFFERRFFVTPRHEWGDNIKIDLNDIELIWLRVGSVVGF